MNRIYTQEELFRIAAMREAFRYAKTRVGDYGFICYALGHVAGSVDARNVVRRALNGSDTLKCWQLLRPGYEGPYSESGTPMGNKHRIMWLNKLIADCQAALDSQGYKG